VKPHANKATLCQHLLDTCTDHSLQEMVSEATHRVEETESLLDLFLTTNPMLIQNTKTIPGIRSHDIIMIDILLKRKRMRVSKRKIYQYKKADMDGLQDVWLSWQLISCHLVLGARVLMTIGMRTIMEYFVVTNLLARGRTRHSGPCNGLLLCNVDVSNMLGDGSGKYENITRNPAIAEGPRDAGVPVEIW